MQLDHFLSVVRHRAGLASKERALSVCEVVLKTLAEHLSGEEPAHVAAQLPPELAAFLHRQGKARSMNLAEFMEEIANREGVDVQHAVHHAHAVMETLEDALTPGEFDDLRAQLPPEFQPLFASDTRRGRVGE